MYIRKKWLAVSYKVMLSFLAIIGLQAVYLDFGESVWRVFATWVLALTTVYFAIAALILGFSKQRSVGDTPSPAIEGAVIVALFLCGITSLYCCSADIPHPTLSSMAAGLVYATLPVLALGDWLLFSKKGAWRLIDPFYWLALPVMYASFVLMSSVILPKTVDWRYPLPFFGYIETDLLNFVQWLIFFGVVIMIFSYALVVIDALLSGKVSQYILLPKIKTVIVEEPAADPSRTTKSKTSARNLSKTNQDAIIRKNSTSPKIRPTASINVKQTSPRAAKLMQKRSPRASVSKTTTSKPDSTKLNSAKLNSGKINSGELVSAGVDSGKTASAKLPAVTTSLSKVDSSKSESAKANSSSA